VTLLHAKIRGGLQRAVSHGLKSLERQRRRQEGHPTLIRYWAPKREGIREQTPWPHTGNVVNINEVDSVWTSPQCMNSVVFYEWLSVTPWGNLLLISGSYWQIWVHAVRLLTGLSTHSEIINQLCTGNVNLIYEKIVPGSWYGGDTVGGGDIILTIILTTGQCRMRALIKGDTMPILTGR